VRCDVAGAEPGGLASPTTPPSGPPDADCEAPVHPGLRFFGPAGDTGWQRSETSSPGDAAACRAAAAAYCSAPAACGRILSVGFVRPSHPRRPPRDSGEPVIGTQSPPADSRLRVLVVENNADLRQLLALTIDSEPDLQCIGSTDRTDDLLALARERRPDVVVMDLLLDAGPSLPMARELHDSVPGTSILVYSGHANPTLAAEARRWGVTEYVTKGGDVDDLLNAIRRCDRGVATSG
jgi:ActR/RegA family two-component response regulator